MSHLPFVLSVTAIDIVLGYPELGLDASENNPGPRLSALLWEGFVQADNHIALCLLLSLPRWMTIVPTAIENEPDKLARETEAPATLLASLEPPLSGAILWVEAQEHYVRITTKEETRMVLARFSDVIREMTKEQGMQVHRSHWVSKAAIVGKNKLGQNLCLTLSTGDSVPVSRSFRQRIDDELAT